MTTKYSQFIQHSRKARGLTQAQLAKKVGCSQGTVSKWEMAKLEPSISEFEKVLKYTKTEYASYRRFKASTETAALK